MTGPRPARGLVPAITRSAIDRREAWLWFLAMFVLSRIAIQASSESLSAFLTSFGEHNLVYWLCYAVMASNIAKSAAVPIDRLTVAALAGGAVALLLLAPANISALDGLVATAAGLLLYRRYADDPGLRRAGVVFVALGVNLFWAQVVFSLLKEQIVVLDAVFTSTVLNVAGYEVERTVNALSANGDFFITIVGACSAFNNISLAALAAIAAIIGIQGDLRRQDIIGIVTVCLLVMAFNTVRLAIFASSHSAYEFWHHGEGAPLLALFQTVLFLGAAFAIALRKRPNPA